MRAPESFYIASPFRPSARSIRSIPLVEVESSEHDTMPSLNLTKSIAKLEFSSALVWLNPCQFFRKLTNLRRARYSLTV